MTTLTAPIEGERVPEGWAVPSPRVAAGRNNRLRFAWRTGACAAASLTALASPAVASAHGRALTVALDYRLPLDPGVGRLVGVKASIVDGDRALRLDVAHGKRVVVLGDLGEPMLRVDQGGVWVNQSSPTAQANRIVIHARPGWKRVARGREFAWHEHRLAPPPFASGQYGRVARWQVPLLVDGRRVAISGSFMRVPRPPSWLWALGALAVVGLAAVALLRRPRPRLATTIATGTVAGLAGLTAQTAFSLRDAPSGHIAWTLVIAAFTIAAIATVVLAVAHGTQRAYVAGTIGVSVAVFCLSWLGVFLHGAVVSALPAQATRLVCLVAFTAGLISLVGVLGVDAAEGADAR
jgi:hypothetical protein